MSQQTSAPIIININDSLDASKNFAENNLLQQKAIDKIKKLVGSRLEKLSNTKNCNDRKHDTITILGERGSGKTSLLLNLETILKKHESKLVFLKIIDPTLFETKQNILVSIISLIADEIKNANKSKDDKWNESLIKLADGLKLLDGVGSDIIKSDLFDDGELILEKGLDHAHSGLNLEKYLSYYISQSLSLLDKKMFILVFDDIDTNIDKGWMVLESIRKYLTSCQLQVFVSGDWELYSSLVRMKQWENFDRKILPEKEWHSKADLVNDLEEQYLIKVLKPEYRIYLENFYQLTKKTEKISVEGFGIKKPIKSIYQYVSNFLFNFQNKSQQEDVSNLIKQLPIRTNMKIFYVYLVNQNDAEELINAISNVFITNTARFNFTHLDYENLSPNAVLQEMAKKLYLLSDEQFSFEKLSQFPMNLSNKDINLLLMVINLHLSKTISTNIHTFFEWLTRFSYLNILGKDKQNQDEKKSLLSKLKYNSSIIMQEQISLLADENNVQTNKKSLLLGFRATYAFTRYAKKQSVIGVDTFQKSENFTLDEKFILNILLSKSGQIAYSEQSNVSIINIFSFLNEFLQKNNNDAPTYLLSLFEEFYYLKGEDHLFKDDKDEITQNPLYKSLLEWHKIKDNVEMLSIFQINRILDNFLKHHESSLQNKKFDYLKDFITAQVTLFLNLLISEILFNDDKVMAYGSVWSPRNLNLNIQKAFGSDYAKNFYDDYKKLDFFRYMYLCPILYCFLQDSKFVIPKESYWIGQNNKNRIHNSFGALGIINAENQKEDLIEYEEEMIGDEISTNILIEKNYLNTSDLNKIRMIKQAEDFEIIEKAIAEVKSGNIKNRYELWNKVKEKKTRLTSEREEILDRFLINIQNDIEANDSSTH